MMQYCSEQHFIISHHCHHSSHFVTSVLESALVLVLSRLHSRHNNHKSKCTTLWLAVFSANCVYGHSSCKGLRLDLADNWQHHGTSNSATTDDRPLYWTRQHSQVSMNWTGKNCWWHHHHHTCDIASSTRTLVNNTASSEWVEKRFLYALVFTTPGGFRPSISQFLTRKTVALKVSSTNM